MYVGFVSSVSESVPDVGGQHCPSPVRVFVRIFQKSCPVSVCLDSVPCPDSVRIFRKKAFRCLSVRQDNDEKELSGPSTSGLCLGPSVFRILDHFFEENSRYSLGCQYCSWPWGFGLWSSGKFSDFIIRFIMESGLSSDSFVIGHVRTALTNYRMGNINWRNWERQIKYSFHK